MHTIDNAYGHEQIMCHGKDLTRSFVRLIAATIRHWPDTNDQKASMGQLVEGALVQQIKHTDFSRRRWQTPRELRRITRIVSVISFIDGRFLTTDSCRLLVRIEELLLD
jgi:hypothetical protein